MSGTSPYSSDILSIKLCVIRHYQQSGCLL
jgi:hypothetical protein